MKLEIIYRWNNCPIGYNWYYKQIINVAKESDELYSDIILQKNKGWDCILITEIKDHGKR